MATSTPNLNLILPDYSDKADISVLNDNFQKIDEYCANGGVSNEELQNAVKAANAWANATASAESVSADKEADVKLTEGDDSKNLHFSIPRGQPGVLISETEPTDPNVKVWIKPDGEPNELEQLKSDVSSLKDQIGDYCVGKNLLGPDPNVYYPVRLKKGDWVTVSTYDGSENTLSVWLNTYDEQKTNIQSVNLAVGAASRSFTLNKDTYYIQINKAPAVPLQFEKGATKTDYEPYFPNPLTNTDSIKALEAGRVEDKEFIEDYCVCKNMVGLDQTVYYPVRIKKGEYITFSTYDGSENTLSVWLDMCDAEKTKVQSVELAVGTANRSFTVNQDTYYLKLSKAPAIPVQAEMGKTRTDYEPYFPNVHLLDERVKTLENASEAAKGSFNSRVNYIADDGWIAKATEFAALFATAGKKENFMFFTDPHLLTGADGWRDKFEEHLTIMQYYFHNCHCDYVVCGGDWLSYLREADDAAWELTYIRAVMRSMFTDKYYNVIGNHDEYYGNNSLWSKEAMRNLWYPEQENCYYTFSGNHTKFYCLDTGNDGYDTMTAYRTGQAKWFAESLKNDSDEHRIVVMHIFSNDSATFAPTTFASTITAIAQAFNNRGSIEADGVTFNYSDVTGRLHCVMCGHNHMDFTTEYNDIPVIGTRNVKGATALPAFDLVCIDYGTNVLKTVGVESVNNRTLNLA